MHLNVEKQLNCCYSSRHYRLVGDDVSEKDPVMLLSLEPNTRRPSWKRMENIGKPESQKHRAHKQYHASTEQLELSDRSKKVEKSKMRSQKHRISAAPYLTTSY